MNRESVAPETKGYATGRRLLSIGNAAPDADDAPGLQEPDVAPALPKRHVNPLFKRAPAHAENSGDGKTPTKDGEEPKPKPSAGGKGKTKDEAEDAGKGKQTNSQPGGTGKAGKAEGAEPEPGAEEGAAEKGGEQGQKTEGGAASTGQEKTQKGKQEEGAADDKKPTSQSEPSQGNKSEDKPPKGSTGNDSGQNKADKEKNGKPGTTPIEGNEPKSTKPDDNAEKGNDAGDEETGGAAKPGPNKEGDSTEGKQEQGSKSTGEEPKPEGEGKPSQGNEKPTQGGEEGRKEPKPAPGEETSTGRNASNNATKASGEEQDKLKNKTKGEEEIDCIRPAYHEFPPDLFSHEARAKGGVVVHILVVLYMFYALAVVCDDYFIASLEECCARLNLSEDVAGATFMAAGSSAPELFTAILGVLIAKGDVGTGTIVGSAVFNVLFVIGLCGLCSGKEVPVTWWPLFRDSIFYAFTVVILIVVIYDGQVTWYDSLCMLLLYGVYIDIMKYNKRIHQWVATTFGIHEEEQTSLGLTSASYDAKNYSSYVPFNNEIDDYAQQNASRNTRPLDEVIRDSRRSVDVALSTDADWKKIPSLRDGPWALFKWVVQAPLLATLHYTVPDCRTATGKRLFLLSFFMSIFWTAAFSYVMVWMVTLIGYTMGIPDTIMGITFLAAGTSIPDAYASLLVSRQGQGDMAIANSIGSNVFDILIGLALPWLIQTGMVEPGSLAYINSGGLVWSVVLLFLTIIITIYTIHRSHWLLTKKLGVFLLVVYGIFLIICSAVEFNLLGYVNPPMCIE
ncbi:hypothetical protein HPB50_019911 [Hyalomma asiaticum]|uniref:Uncharacterized protein n=1 Tax=Hyalomma asiaticum TaxID=266040 RepID=A0ACB7RVW9_HYAAI|nr:hypothetical protein HPB50_019911 [Hyalomma asiaticum]